MITLSVLQQGNIIYTTATSQQFNPDFMSLFQQVAAYGDSTCTQFNYCGTTYIVSESRFQVYSAITTAYGYVSTIELAGVKEDNVTRLLVSYNLQNVQYVADIDGYAGIMYAYTPDAVGFRATTLAVSTTNTDFATVDSTLVTYGFRRVEQDMNDGTTRTIYLNMNAVESVVGSISTYWTYMLPNGEQITDTSTANTYTVDFTGILAGDTLDTILTDASTLTVNLGCVTAPNRTAIAAAITAYLVTLGAQSGTVAVTEPSAGKLRIVIPTCNVQFINAKCTLSSVLTTESFVQS